MEHPLVEHAERLVFAKVSHTLFGKHREPERCNDRRNAVVDFRIDMVRAAAEYDRLQIAASDLGHDSFAFASDIALVVELFLPGEPGRALHLVRRDIRELLYQPFREPLNCVHRQEGHE